MTMTADKARVELGKSTRRAARLAAKQARDEAAAERQRRKQILRKDVPFRMREFAKELKDAIAARHSTFTFNVNNGIEGNAVKARLEKRGFIVSHLQHEHGTTNMGDFNAPCNVDYDRYWFDVTIPTKSK